MARTRLTNPAAVVELKYNPYQQAFFAARRMRQCVHGCTDDAGAPLTWSVLDSLVCPSCERGFLINGVEQRQGMRPFRRFFLRAGRRGGKTRAGAISAVEEMMVPDSKGWVCAPSYPELEDYVMPNFFAVLPQEWFEHPLTEWSEDRYHLRLPNGAEVHFRSLDDPNRGAGPGLDWVWIDEGRKIQELAWHLLRPSLTERKGIAFVTSTPDWGEDWCHKNFFGPAEDGRPGYWAVSYLTKDNPIIDPAEVEEARATMPPELFRREYEASIEYPTGTIYGELIDKVDAVDELIREWLPEWPNIDPSRQAIAALDPGTDHPFAGCVIVPTPSGLAVIGEYEERRQTYFEHQKGLKAMVRGLQPRWGIDRSQAQAALELSQYGIYCQGAENDVNAGIQRVYAWMASGRMRISRTACPRLLKRLRGYRWADVPETKRGLQPPAPFKKDDDLPDALRYGVMLWPELPTPKDWSLEDAQARNLALLQDKFRQEIEREMADLNLETPDGLVRVTDDFTHVYVGGDSVLDGGLGQFWE